jgi:hypothetical protein
VSKNFKVYVRYDIKRQSDGSYAILKKDLVKKKVDIHSTYDTYEEARATLEDLESKPSQADALKMMSDLRLSIDSIK